MNNQSMLRKVDMPANLFSNLGGKDFSIPVEEPKEDSFINTNKELANDMKEYYESGEIKLNKFSSRNQYRERLNRIYEELKELKPIDSEIPETLFSNNYVEKGIVIKPTIQELKQFWTEYRLMNNEQQNKIKEEKKYNNPTAIYNDQEKEVSEFDDLFDKLTQKVDEINDYIEELKEWRKNVDNENIEIAKEKENLEKDRESFLNYKQEEEEKIRKEKEEIKTNYNRLQNLIDNIDTTLNIDEVE